MAPVFASIDVKICQEFHSLLVKIHCQGVWLPSRELCDLTGPSCSHPHPTPPLLLGYWREEHCPALEKPLPQPAWWVTLGHLGQEDP